MTSLPCVTILMPVRNESATIRQALQAVQTQDYPADRLEILVIDGDSTDDTAAIVRACAANDPRVRLLHNPARRQAHGFNLGLQYAGSEIIIRVDGHTFIAPDYVRRCVHTLRTTGAANVGGMQRIRATTPFEYAVKAAYRSPFGVPSHFTTGGRAGPTDTVYLGAWPRHIFDRVGHFDETLVANEDYEHNVRIRQQGGQVWFDPAIQSEYVPRSTLGALWRQFYRYGQGKAAVLHKHPTSARPRHLVAPTFVAALAGGTLLAPFVPFIRRMWRGVLVAYGLTNGLASWLGTQEIDRPQRRRARCWLPAVFATMHVAWGCGFWVGLFRQLWMSGQNRR